MTAMRVLVTRPAAQAKATIELLRKHGFEVQHQPCLQIVPVEPQSVDGLQSKQWAMDLDKSPTFTHKTMAAGTRIDGKALDLFALVTYVHTHESVTLEALEGLAALLLLAHLVDGLCGDHLSSTQREAAANEF